MAAINVVILYPFESFISRDYYYLTDDLDNFQVDYYPAYASDGGLREVTGLTFQAGKNLPVETIHYPVNIGAAIVPSYFNDYYNRIHIVPSRIELGNITSLETQQVEVWNAFYQTNPLSSISTNTLDGVTFTDVLGLTAYKPLESRLYDLTALVDGQAVIDGAVTLNFGTGTVSIPVTGQRGFIFPFAPLTSYKEQISWTSDVIQTISEEQVLSLRDIPKQTLSYSYRFRTFNELSLAKNIAAKYIESSVLVPIWSQAVNISNVPAASTSILIDTSALEINPGDTAVIYKNYLNYEVVQVLSFTISSITFKEPTVGTFTTPICFIPCRSVYPTKGFDFQRAENTNNTLQVTFDNTKGFVQPSIVGYTLFNALPVIENTTPLESALSESFYREMEYLDNNLGDLLPISLVDYTRHRRTLNFVAHGKVEIFKMKRFLDYLKGKFGTFYIPSFSPDAQPLVTTLTSGDTSIPVKIAGFYLNPPKVIRIIGDTTVTLNVTGAVKSGLDESIQFTTTPGITGIKTIQVLTKCRADTDNFTINYNYSKQDSLTAKVSIPILEVL
jgi:hypothetical protein